MIGLSKKKLKQYMSMFLATGVLLTNTQTALANVNIKSVIGESILQKNNPWDLVWSDEFDGSSLDEGNWSYDVGNWIVDGDGNGVAQGWGNNELEYYTPGDNISLKDGNLVITAKKEQKTDKFGTYDYTSSKIKTKDKVTTKYGRIEARMQLPEGSGLWPAFWMMPNDDVYGTWASSGEIDIMESRGYEPYTIDGTIHYGSQWPNNKYSGKKGTIPNGGRISEFHEYAVEWEPGEIRWYIDGVLYSTQNSWNSTAANGEKYSFPAPFDQDFYIILNLAIGGWFVDSTVPEANFESADMLVDYVRVYEKTDGYSPVTKEPVAEKEALPQGAYEAIDGNYIYDVNFETGFDKITSEPPFTKDWYFLTGFGGTADVNIDSINGKNFANVSITNGGQQNYAVQLIQYATLTKGHSYKLSFDAKSTTNRDMSVKLAGGSARGWTAYSDNFAPALTSDVKHYEYTFDMTADSDVNARLEFNMGLNTNPIWIGNVKIEEYEKTVNYDGPKEPLEDGNYIYNGAFDKGLVNRLTYWNLEKVNGVEASYSVGEDTRELFVDLVNGGANVSDIRLNQKGIKLAKDGKYELTFNARATAEKSINVVFKNDNEEIVYQQPVVVGTTMGNHTVKFDLAGVQTSLNGKLELQLGGNNTDLYLDNVFLKNNGAIDTSGLTVFPLKNGDFTQGTAGWESWSAVGATTKVEAGKAIINVPNKFAPNAETWAVQFKQAGLQLYKGLEYVISFDASSTINRKFELVAQNSGYYRHFDQDVNVGTETKRYTYTFVPNGDDKVELNFLLGKYEEYDPHSITIDNVVFEVKNPTKNKIVNNKFNDGTNPWSMWSEVGANSSILDGKYEVTIPSLGGAFWSVQVQQNGLSLEKGKSYRLVFDMASSIVRKIEAVVENQGYSKALDQVVNVNEELNTYILDFVYGMDNDTNMRLNFCLGKVEGQEAVGNHVVTLDNVYLYEVPDLSAEVKPEAPKTITTMVATQGPVIDVEKGKGTGFTFPTFNGGASKFDDIKNDLAVLVKENGQYIPVETSSKLTYDSNWGNFWDGPGGYWFNPVNETTYIKLVSKSNPGVSIEYTLKVAGTEEPEAPKTITTMVATQGPVIDVEKGKGTGFTFPTFNGGASKFDDIKNDLAVLVKENGQYIPVETSSKLTYDSNWGNFWDGPGGYWFNPVNETTYIKLVSKSNPGVFIEYTLKVEGSDDNNGGNTGGDNNSGNGNPGVEVKPVNPNKPVVDKVENPNGENKVKVEANNGAFTVEITDVNSIKNGTGSLTIESNSQNVSVPFTAIDPSLLKEGSKVVVDIKEIKDSEIIKGLKTVGKVFEFNLSVVTGDEVVNIHKFNNGMATITLTLTDDELKGLDKSKLTVFYYNEESKKYEAMETTVDGNKVTFKTPHFSKFIVAEKTINNEVVTLPNTGGTNVMPISILGMLITISGLVVLRKREKSLV